MRGHLGRGAWAVLSQALSTLTNLGLAILVARGADQAEFGAWALSYMVYVVLLSLNRAVVCTPLLIGVRGEDEQSAPEWEANGAFGTGLALGLVVAAVLALTGWLAGGAIRPAAWALGAVLPGLLLQDVARHVCFARNQPRGAAALDALWAALQLAGFAAILWTSREGVVLPTLTWGVAGGMAGLVGILAVRGLPGPAATIAFVRRHRRSSLSLAADAGMLALSNQAVPAVVAAFGGLSAAGALRAGQTLFGPVGTMVMGLTPIALAEARRRAGGIDPTRRRWPRTPVMALLWRWVIGIGLFSTAYAVAVLALPRSVGQELLGDSWSGAELVLVPLALQAMLRGGLSGPPLVLRAEHRLRDMLRLRMALVVPALGLPALGTVLSGARGAAWGLAAFAIFATLAGFAVVLRREAQSEQVGGAAR